MDPKEQQEQEPDDAATDTEGDDATSAEGTDVLDADEGVSQLSESDGEAEKTVVSFGDDDDGAEGEDDYKWVKDLRQRNRDQTKEINKLKKEREQYIQPPVTVLSARPTLEEADYDADVFENNLTGWLGQKADIDAQEFNVKQQQDSDERAWTARQSEFVDGQKDFDPDEYKYAEDTLKSVLNGDQQSHMVHVAGNKAASLIMGLARDGNSKQMRALAAIKDPLLFAAAVGRLEEKMTVSKTRPKTTPETRVKANGGGATSSSHLEILRDKAAKDGDYTAVIAYKRQAAAAAS